MLDRYLKPKCEENLYDVRGRIRHGKAVDLTEEVEKYERDIIRFALIACGFHREKTAAFIGVSRTTLWAKMKRYNIRISNLKRISHHYRDDAAL